MAEYTSKTIEYLLNAIEKGKVVLPAIQRNFVWTEEKVCNLFDSIMRDYPIGTFLFWEVDNETVNEYVFNEFIKCYDEQTDLQRGKRVDGTRTEYIGVLDGQQRITSLYLGFKGYYRMRLKGRRRDDPSSYVNRYLCMNVFQKSVCEEETYAFAFKTGTEIEEPITNEKNEIEFWVKVSRVLEDGFEAATYIEDIEEKHFSGVLQQAVRRQAREMLNTLSAAYKIKQNVTYYPAQEKDLAQVVDIFVRVNSGGQKLFASDLMLSVATGEQGTEDIHVKMKEAIDTISAATINSETGFVADKELILTAGLLCTGAGSLSLQKKENYQRIRINAILEKWDEIIDSLCVAAQFIERIGFSGRKLTSKNLLLPIAYYFYVNNIDEKHLSSTKLRARKDRVYIRQWLLRAMINSVFRDGTGSTLIGIRNVIDVYGKEYFPLDRLMNSTGVRSLIITSDKIDDIFNYKYGDGRIAPLLTELSKDDTGRMFVVDHIWPQKLLQSKKELKVLLPGWPDEKRKEYKQKCHSLANLQILEPRPNEEKSARLFNEWLQEVHGDPGDRYYDDSSIPRNISYDFDNFIEFLECRSELLRKKMEEVLLADFATINKRNHLEE